MDVTRQRLSRIIERYGEGLLNDHGKAEDLIRDLCGQDQDRIELLIAALNMGLVDELVRWRGQAEPVKYVPRLARSLELRGASPQEALWATAAWAVATKVLDEEAADSLSAVTPPSIITARSPKPLPAGQPPDHGGFLPHIGLIVRIGGVAMLFLCILWPLHCINSLFKSRVRNDPRQVEKLDPAQVRIRFALSQQWALEREVKTLQFSSDGGKLFSFGPGAPLTAWEPASGSPLKALSFEDYGPAALSADGARLAVYTGEAGIGVLDLESEINIGQLEGSLSRPDVLAFSPDGRFLLSVTEAGRRMDLWDAVLMRPFLIKEFPHQGGPGGPFAFSPDSRRIAMTRPAGSAMDILEIGAVNLDPVGKIEGRMGRVLAVCFDGEGTRLATSNEDRTIRVWDSGDGNETLRIATAPDVAEHLIFHPKFPLLLAKTEEGGVRVWDLRSGKEVGRLDVSARAVALSPDGSILAIQGYVASNDPKRPSQPVIKTYNLTDKGLEP